jgi:ABC-type proline/glycine betaine transport system substrate-binding protein
MRVLPAVRGGIDLEDVHMITGDKLWDAQTALSDLLEKPGWTLAERDLIEDLSDAMNDDDTEKVQTARAAIMAAKGVWAPWKQALLWLAMEKVQEAFP